MTASEPMDSTSSWFLVLHTPVTSAEGCIYSIPPGERAFSLPRLGNRTKESNASIARVPGGSGAAQAARPGGPGRGRQGSRDSRAPTSTECPSATGQTASLSTFRPGVSRRRGWPPATGSLGALSRDPEDAAALAPGAGPVEVGSIQQASWGQAAAAGRAAGADPAPGKREPEMGLQTHPGRTSKARDQGVGHRDQKAARPSRPRAGAPPRGHDLT